MTITKTLLVVFLIFLPTIALLGYLGYLYQPYEPIVKLVPVQSPIPSIREIQQRLKDLDNPRYDPGKIDGKISLTGKTQKAWNNYICDQFAKRAIEGK